MESELGLDETREEPSEPSEAGHHKRRACSSSSKVGFYSGFLQRASKCSRTCSMLEFCSVSQGFKMMPLAVYTSTFV